jgi:hypothetical protein
MSTLSPKLSPVQKVARYTEILKDKIYKEHPFRLASESIEHIISSKVNVEASPRGDVDTFDYRVQSLNGMTQEEVSLWHDIPIFPTTDSKAHNIVNMVNEVRNDCNFIIVPDFNEIKSTSKL